MLTSQRIFQALNERDVKYVVVGGIAVVLHGHARLATYADLVVSLDEQNARAAIDALTSIGFVPRVPVDPLDFASAEARRKWVADKNMMVFTMIDPQAPFMAADLFLSPPIPFDELYDRSEVKMVGHVPVRVCSLPDLLQIKRESGRPQDLLDVKTLEDLQDDG